ncbi:S-layer homology domain-containing protein [Neobacillus sp. D3-1R]|uniref:S-layer homology domain-containing protein n=1 Tax=Neobacillus sp. D3-1R TaxID=3445778 RepID=UPI003F9F61A9
MRRFRQSIAIICTMFLLFGAMSPTIQAKAIDNNKTFKDIENYWAKDSIESLIEMGIINGYEDGTFRPGNKVTRGQFIALITRLMGYKEESATPYFKDINEKNWMFPYAQAAVEKGIVFPEELGNSLKPNTPLSREEMAIMMVRTLKLGKIEGANVTFKDTNQITVDKELIATAVHEGLITGHEDHTFKPKDTTTRGQAAVILYRLYQYSIHTDNPDVPTAAPAVENHVDEIDVLDTVKEISPKTMDLLTEVKDDDSTFVFSEMPEELKNLKSGDIFTLPPSKKYPTGFAEKVVSINSVDGKTEIKTVNPELEEVFQTIDVKETTEIQYDNIVPIEMADGVELLPASGSEETTNSALRYVDKPQYSAQAEGDFKVAIKELVFDIGGQKVKVNGDIVFKNAELITDVDYKLFKLKSLEARFISDPTLTVKLQVPKTIGSVEGNVKGSYTNVYKGIDFGGKATVPAFMNKTDSTKPFEKRKSLGRLYVPVYGPIGGSLEVFLVLKADLSLGVEVKVVENMDMEIGVIAKKGSVDGIGKVKFTEPTFTIKGEGGIQAKAGAGLGIKVAIYKLDVGGFEGETGLKGEIYGRAATGYGESANPDETEKSWQGIKFCYRAGIGTYVEFNATFDILKKLGLKASLNLVDKSKTFAEATNCKDSMLIPDPSIVIVAPGENTSLNLDLYYFDKLNLDLTKATDTLSDDNLTFDLNGDKEISIKKSKNKFDIKVDPAAKGGEVAELKLAYKDEVTETVKIIVTTLKEIKVDPSPVEMLSKAQTSLSVQAIFEDVHHQDVTKEDLTQDITASPQISYVSKDSSVVTVDSKGVITAKDINSEKSTEIEISYKGKKVTVPVKVKAIDPTSGNTGSGGGASPVENRNEQIKELILKAEEKANEVFKAEAEAETSAEFDSLIPMLQDRYSENYLAFWKKIYRGNIKWFLDPHLLYPLTEAIAQGTGATFEVKSVTTDTIKASVKVPLRENEIPNDKFEYEYTLKKVENNWLLDEISCNNCERPE